MADENSLDVLQQIYAIVLKRAEADPSDSYVASLNAKGVDAILKKIGEEATETVIAAKGDDADQLIYEMADLWFHTLVLLAHENIEPSQIYAELKRRMGVSGIEEKRLRSDKG